MKNNQKFNKKKINNILRYTYVKKIKSKPQGTLTNTYRMDFGISFRLNKIWTDSRYMKSMLKTEMNNYNKVIRLVTKILKGIVTERYYRKRSLFFNLLEKNDITFKNLMVVINNLYIIDKYVYLVNVYPHLAKLTSMRETIKIYRDTVYYLKNEQKKTDFLRKFYRKEEFWKEHKDLVLSCVDNLLKKDLSETENKILVHTKRSILLAKDFKDFRERLASIRSRYEYIEFYSKTLGDAILNIKS